MSSAPAILLHRPTAVALQGLLIYVEPKRAIPLPIACCCSQVSCWYRLLWHMLRVLWSHPSTTAGVFTTLSIFFYWFPLKKCNDDITKFAALARSTFWSALLAKWNIHVSWRELRWTVLILNIDEFPRHPVPPWWTGASPRVLERVFSFPAERTELFVLRCGSVLVILVLNGCKEMHDT